MNAQYPRTSEVDGSNNELQKSAYLKVLQSSETAMHISHPVKLLFVILGQHALRLELKAWPLRVQVCSVNQKGRQLTLTVQ